LADADRRREMDHRIDMMQGLSDRIGIADIADDKLSLGAQIAGSIAAPVDLRGKIIEQPDGIAFGEQDIRDMRANESGPSGYQDTFHDFPNAVFTSMR